MNCNAYRNGEPCPIRFDCQLYKNFLTPYINATFDEKIAAPFCIETAYKKNECKNFVKRNGKTNQK